MEPVLQSPAQNPASPSPRQDVPPAAAWDAGVLAGRLVELTCGGEALLRPAQIPRQIPNQIPKNPPAMANIWDISPLRDAGSAALSAAASLMWKAQQAGEPVAWISARASTFFPPDFDACGIDLAALVVVRTTDAACAARAADKLLRSGAFALVMLDLGARASISSALVSRLLGLARKHCSAVVFLTEKSDDAASLSPIVSLRVRAERLRTSSGRFTCSIRALKDKTRAPGWTVEETLRAPPGLR